jgi:hypothetical protein
MKINDYRFQEMACIHIFNRHANSNSKEAGHLYQQLSHANFIQAFKALAMAFLTLSVEGKT